MKLRWTTTEIDFRKLLAATGSINSVPWRGHDAESVMLDISGDRVGDEWTLTAVVSDAPEPIMSRHENGTPHVIAFYEKTDFAFRPML